MLIPTYADTSWGSRALVQAGSEASGIVAIVIRTIEVIILSSLPVHTAFEGKNIGVRCNVDARIGRC